MYLCGFYLSQEKRANFALPNRNWLVFITEIKSVYCAVRSGSLNETVYAASLKGLFNLCPHTDSWTAKPPIKSLLGLPLWNYDGRAMKLTTRL
jgi:hypothetical protein